MLNHSAESELPSDPLLHFMLDFTNQLAMTQGLMDIGRDIQDPSLKRQMKAVINDRIRHLDDAIREVGGWFDEDPRQIFRDVQACANDEDISAPRPAPHITLFGTRMN